jgi:hypothetical protein
MKYTEFLANTRNLLATIDDHINGIGFDGSVRNKFSAALFDIVHDHAKAIVILLEEQIYASVYALVRPLFETFVRATWIQHCSSDDEITEVIKKDKFKLKFGEMLEAVEKKLKWEKVLTQVKNHAWESMHSYTHGGVNLASRRFKDSFVEHNFDEDEIVELLQLVALISFLSFSEMRGMSIGYGKEDKVLADLLGDLCQWCFADQIK